MMDMHRWFAGWTAAALLGLSALGAEAPSSESRDTSVEGVFAPESTFYRPLPDDTPVAEDSEELIASLYRQGVEHFGRPGQPNVTINMDNYTAPLYATNNGDPQHDIRPWNCQGKGSGWDAELAEMLRGRHLPANFRPDASSDGNVSIYNTDSGEIVELWRTRQAPDGVWEACWGGVIEDASDALGTFPVPYGAAAGGLAMWGYTIRHQELLDGHIGHVVAMGIPRIKQGVISWPAVRTDGRVEGSELAMGQMMRLPADFDLDALNLSPAARTVAEAAQDYGILITDTSGALAFYAEHEFGVPDARYDEIFRGRSNYQEMAGDPARGEDPFPLQELVALPVDYGKDLFDPLPTASPDELSAAPDEPQDAAIDMSVALRAGIEESGSTTDGGFGPAGLPWLLAVAGLLAAGATAAVGAVALRRARRARSAGSQAGLGA